MENKRLVIAVLLSIAIFLGWNYFSMKMGWIPSPSEKSIQQNATAPSSEPQDAPARTVEAADPSSLAASSLPAFSPTSGQLVSVDTPLYRAVFHSNGGILREFYLKRYKQSLAEDAPLVSLITPKAADQAPLGLLVDRQPSWTRATWTLEGGNLSLQETDSGILRFIGEMDGMRIVRELVFTGDTYAITETARVASPAPRVVNLAFTLNASSLITELTPSIFATLRYAVFGGAKPVAAESQYNLTRAAWLQNGSFTEETPGSDLTTGILLQGNVSWTAVMNNYFLAAVSMAGAEASAKASHSDDVFHVFIGKTGLSATPEQEAVQECTYFLGPKDSRLLAAAPNDLAKALNYGWFSIIARPLVALLQFFHGFVHNYGVAIILMTVVIKILFWPLSQKSYKSMQQMRKLQPMMAKIREKHAGDKETMNTEIMQLYKTYKVNPAGGCLPILVQIPVFFGLYQALLNAIDLRHASFVDYLPFTDTLWLADLAAPDPYLITPLFMGLSMFIQQKMTPAPPDPTQAKVMMFMPLIFLVLFVNFPSGLVVYWLANNIISIFQQWWQLKRSS